MADPFGEFFVQSKISQFNTEREDVFYGLNYSCDFSQTYLMQGLFPYFITEQNAREIAVLGRIAAEVRQLKLRNEFFDTIDLTAVVSDEFQF